MNEVRDMEPCSPARHMVCIDMSLKDVCRNSRTSAQAIGFA